MSEFTSRIYIGGKVASSATVTSASLTSLTEPRMSVERALIALGRRAGAELRTCKTAESIAADKARAELMLRGKFKTAAELAALAGGDEESDESDI
ncbi:hypothetical protein WJ542_11325 [Paraburkholderia sp. B3]|uniref:hypothetical protein n=1 Tax=Paraburkholderia sp. B3 TaxID=3134791 RepID=UPI00398271DF